MQACKRRDRRCEFLSEPTTVNAFNEVPKRPDSEWTVVARAYAHVETRGGREVLRAQQVHAEINAIVNVEWTSGLDAIREDHRVRVYKPNQTYETFEIRFADNVDFANQEIKFWCTATVT